MELFIKKIINKVGKPSMARRLTLMLSLFTAAIISFVIFYEYYANFTKISYELEGKATDYSKKISEVINVPLWSYDEKTINSIGYAFSQNENIYEIKINDSAGDTVFSFVGKEKTKYPLIVKKEKIIYKNYIIGDIKVSLSSDKQRKDLNRTLYFSIILMLSSLLGIFLFTTYILKIIMKKPLAKLEDGINRVAAGDFRYNFYELKYDELKSIGEKFSEMAAKVEEREKKLKETNVNLEHEVEERKKVEESLKISKEAAEMASVAKGQFLANMSHEIRTPMNGIIGMIEILEMSNLNSQQSRYLSMISNSADSLLQIINDILDFSKIEAGKIELDEKDFSIEALVEKTIDNFVIAAHTRGIELIYYINPNVPSYLFGDFGRLKQILINLIGNAIKFTHNGEIVVTVEKMMEEEKEIMLKFSISDTGVGIPADKQKYIFDYFYQVDSTYTKKYSGTGIGLAICKRLVEMMGGFITVESEEGKGSRFYFTVTLRVNNENPLLLIEKNNMESLSDVIEGKKVVVIDDNLINKEIVKEMLSEYGCFVTTASSGVEGIEIIKDIKEEIDMIILDLNMPEMDGIETAEVLIKELEIEEKYMMMLTSVDTPDAVEKIKKLGIETYLIKPIKKKELVKKLADLFSKNIKSESEKGIKVKNEKNLNEIKEIYKEKRILVVEDNFLNMETVTIFLKNMHYHVLQAENGLEAIKILKRENVDLILMDIQMPEMDGIEATKVIREEKLAEGVAIIALTAYAMNGDKEKFLEAGMNEYIPKPIKSSELYEKVAKFIKNN